MGLPKEIADLIERFERNHEAYKSGQYNEMQLRQEFLDPFFAALGWDMNNQQDYAEAYKDVIHEDSIKVGADTKAPDYCFRIGGARKFFLEAKKPSVYIKEDISPAFQLRRYAWSAKLPLSILTDFEEFAVYDARIKPEKTDKASNARIHYFTYKDYEKQWDLISSVFSREAVLKGSFDKYAEKSRLKKGTATVDDAFLKEIEDWRDLLARNIALRNANLSQRELNFAVQRTIDRIVFLRICEDRGIEEYGRLQTQLNGTNVYKRLVQLFSQADDRYNSGLFHFQREKERHEEPDKLTPNISIDDKPLKDIINRLYYPESPYEFSVFSADILGQVYEQFLGKVIRLTAGHQAKVEEKPEVRKAGGVYYTPKYIVDYIVQNTVGKLLSHPPLEKGGKGGFEASDVNPPHSPFVKGGVNITPKEASRLRILDPACGSGSFLLGAYQYLLDWHLKWYIENEPEKWAKVKQPAVYQGPSHDPRTPNWHLTTAEKKRILLNNIYGVDIDSQAVEVTKLSLLLKVLEGENSQTLANQLRIFHERALPDLGDNIKCGNSLIGPDFYQQQTMLDDEERYRVNVFDWEKEFSQVFSPSPRAGEGRGEGGFDAVIGNPPYGAEFQQDTIEYLKNHYSTFVWRGESYLIFVEKAVNLIRPGGLFGYIIPDTYLNLGFTQALRNFLLQNTKINEVVSLPSSVFSSATVDTTLLFAEKAAKIAKLHISGVRIKIFNKKTTIDSLKQPDREMNISTSVWDEHGAFVIQSNPDEINVIRKAEDGNKWVSDYAEMFYGIKCYQVGKGNPPQTKEILEKKPFTSDKRKNKTFLAFYDGKHIGRYELFWNDNNWINYGDWLAEPRKPAKFEGEKLLIRKIIGKTLIATYIPDTSYCNTLLYILKLNPNVEFGYKYLLGVLNSTFISWYFRKKFQISVDDTFPQIMIRNILQFPIAVAGKSLHNKMVTLVEQMLSLNKRLPEVKTDHEKTALQRQIDATDRQIDQLVYELYGLTADEIKLVKGAE